MCLIVKTEDKARIKAALAADPVAGLAKVMDLKKLQKNFSRFEDRRALAGAYDLFLADDRILSYLPKALGTKFFAQKKQPVPVRVSRKDVSFAVRAVYQRTQMVVSTGACTNVKVAHLGMSVDEIVENVIVAMNNCAAHIPKGWNGVQSINLKTSESVALPIYNSLASLAKLPPMPKKVALAKRKLEEAGVDTTAPQTVAKKAKKTVETPTKKAKKTEEAPAKKETKKEAKKESKKDSKKDNKKEEVGVVAAPTKKESKKAKEAQKEEVAAAGKKESKKESKKEAAAPAKKEKKDKKADKTEEVAAPAKKADKKEGKKEKKEAAPVKEEKKKEAKKAKKEVVAASPAKKPKKVTADAAPKVRKEKKKNKADA